MHRYTVKKSKSHKKRNVLAVFLVLVLAAGVLFGLEKTNITNLISTKPADTTTETERGVNDVDYSPATDTDNEDINQKKEDGSILISNDPPAFDSSIEIVFIANSQDGGEGKPLVIRTQLHGVNDGTCKLTLTKGSQSVEKSSSIKQSNTYFVCDGFDIPKSELTNGNWDISLLVTEGDGRYNEATTSATIQ